MSVFLLTSFLPIYLKYPLSNNEIYTVCRFKSKPNKKNIESKSNQTDNSFIPNNKN